MNRKVRLLSLLLVVSLLVNLLATTVLALDTAKVQTVVGATDAMPAIDAAFADKKLKEVSLEDDGYIGIPAELTIFFDSENHEVIPSYGGTPLVLYVVNTATERIGTDSDVEIITDMLTRGFLVAVLDYKNSEKSVSPELDWSTQQLRTRLLEGEFFEGTGVDPDALYAEGYTVPAGYNISENHIFWEIDKHGADGSLEKIVEIWNNDFRGVKGETVIYWLDADGNKKPTQNAIDGTEPVWEDESHIKIKYTKAETIYDCTKKDGSPIDLNLYLTVVYPTNPENEVPVFCYASSGEDLLRSWNKPSSPHLTSFLFAGYAGVCYDYCYTPMARNDHYGYYDGDAMEGHVTGDNQTYSLDVYNEKKTNTAAMRYIRYLAETEGETFKFDTDSIGVLGHSKSGVVTFLGAEHPELFDEARFFPGHRGETRYENGITADDEYGLIDGGEEQPWLTYSDGTEISSRANFVCASAGSRYELIGEGHAPTFLIGAMQDVAYYAFYPGVRNQLEAYDVPVLYLRVADIAHVTPQGIDCDYGLDAYYEMIKFAHYWLRGDAAECVWITPTHATEGVSTTGAIEIKFNGAVSYEEIQKVTVINRETATLATGRWESSFGDTRWTFYPDALDGGCVYTVTVPDTIVDSVNGKRLKTAKSVSFRTEYEVTDASALSAGALTLVKTDSDESGAYYLFNIENLSDEYLLRLKVENDAHNTLAVYALDSIDKTDLIASTHANEPIGRLYLSGEGYYELDVTEAVNASEGEIGFYVCSEKIAGVSEVYLKDFEDSTVGLTTLPKNLYYESYCDGIISDDLGTVALKVNMLHNGDRVASGKEYSAKFVNNTFYENPRPALTIGATFVPDSITAVDYGRTYKFSARVYDTTSRLVVFKVGELSVSNNLELADYKPMQFSFFTTAGEWSTFEFEFTLDNPDYWNGLYKNKVTLMLNSTGGEDCPIYIDDITVDESVSDVTLGGAELVSYPTDTQVFAPDGQFAFDGEGNLLDELVIGGSGAGYEGHGAKAIVKYATSAYDKYKASNLASFHIATDGAATVTVYGVTDTSWSASSVNWFNLIANDRFGGGVNTESVYLGEALGSFEVDGTGTYSIDVSEYMAYMCSQNSTTAALIITAEDSDSLMKLTPVGGTVVFYENYEDGTTKRFPNTKIDGVSAGMDEYSEYDFCTRGTETYPTLASKAELTANATPFGSDALKMNFTASSTAIKFFNIFGKNLTEEDVGDEYTVRFYLSTDAESYSVRYGFMSSTEAYSSPYTGDKLYNPLTNTAASNNSENVVELHAGEWTEVEFTFTVTELMVGSNTNFSNAHSDGTGSYEVHINYALLAFLCKSAPDSSVNVFIDDILAVKTQKKVASEYGLITSFDYDEVTLNTFKDTKVNNISLGIDEYCPDYTTVTRSTSNPTLSSDYDHTTGTGKSLVMVMDNKNAMLKIPNLFGKNLTEDDLGDYYTLTFYATADIDSLRFAYGFASSTTEYISPYTGDKIYDPVQNKTGNIYSPTVSKGTWTKFSLTFPITESMLGSNMNQTIEYGGETYTVHCNYALLVFRAWYDSYNAGGNYVNSHLYIDDISVTRTLKDGTVPVSGSNILDEGEYASVDGTSDRANGVLGGADVTGDAANGGAAYLTFDKGDFTDARHASLVVPFVGSVGTSVKVYGILDPVGYDGVFSLDKAYGGAPLGIATVGADGKATFDVTEYLLENLNTGYGFVVMSEDKSALKYIGINLASYPLTDGVDYALSSGAVAKRSDAGLAVSGLVAGGAVRFNNVFGAGNKVIGSGSYTVNVTVSNDGAADALYTVYLADSTGTRLGDGSALTVKAGESGRITLTLDATAELIEAGASTVLVESTDGAAMTVTSIDASAVSKITVDEGSELAVELPPVALPDTDELVPLVNVTLYTDFVFNVYFPAVSTLKCLTLDGETYTAPEKLPVSTVGGRSYYVLSVPLGATEAMRDLHFSATLLAEDGREGTGTWTLSMQDYCSRILSGDYGEAEKTLVADMLSYIRSAYSYFSFTLDESDVTAAREQIDALIGADYDEGSVPSTDTAALLSTEGLSSAALLINSAPTFLFKPKLNDEGEPMYALESYTFYIDGRECNHKVITLSDGSIAFALDIYAYMMLGEVSYTIDGTEIVGEYNLKRYYDFAKDELKDEALTRFVERLWKYSESAKLYKNSIDA